MTDETKVALPELLTQVLQEASEEMTAKELAGELKKRKVTTSTSELNKILYKGGFETLRKNKSGAPLWRLRDKGVLPTISSSCVSATIPAGYPQAERVLIAIVQAIVAEGATDVKCSGSAEGKIAARLASQMSLTVNSEKKTPGAKASPAKAARATVSESTVEPADGAVTGT